MPRMEREARRGEQPEPAKSLLKRRANAELRAAKRDYAYLADLLTADDVLRRLPLESATTNTCGPTRASKCFHLLNSGISNWHQERVRSDGRQLHYACGIGAGLVRRASINSGSHSDQPIT